MLNFFKKNSTINCLDNRSTNASAESFNAKIKAFRSQFRGVRNIWIFISINPDPRLFYMQVDRNLIFYCLIEAK
jgi:hypothetical protein